MLNFKHIYFLVIVVFVIFLSNVFQVSRVKFVVAENIHTPPMEGFLV